MAVPIHHGGTTYGGGLDPYGSGAPSGPPGTGLPVIPPHIPVEPWVDPAAGGGGMGGGGAGGGYFDVGYGGTNGGVGTPTGGGGGGGGLNFGFPVGSPQWQASKAAYDQMMAAADQGLQRLAPGQFLGGAMGGALGNAAMTRYTNPHGFDQAALQGQQAMIRDSFAGQQANAVRNIEQSAAAKGFGDSMGTIDAAARARASANQGQNNALNQLMFENERAKLAQSGTAAGLLGGLAGAEGDYGLAYAASQMDRQFPVIPGVTGSPEGGYGGGGQYGGGDGGWWNQQGRYMTSPAPYDPFLGGYGQNDNRGTAGGWNPQQPRPMW